MGDKIRDKEKKSFDIVRFRAPVSSIFPLTRTSFMNVSVMAPGDTRRVLVGIFGESVFTVCQTYNYDHRFARDKRYCPTNNALLTNFRHSSDA